MTATGTFLALLTGLFGSSEMVIHLDAAHRAVSEAESLEKWVIAPSGVVGSPDDSLPEPTDTREIRVLSASSGKPINGAKAWLIEDKAPVPLLPDSPLRTSDSGALAAPALSGWRLRVAAPGHEMVEIEPPYPATLILWPLDPRSLEIRSNGEPAAGIAVRYELRPGLPLRSVTDSDGTLSFPTAVREGIRIDVDDPRFRFQSLVLKESEKTIDLEPSHPLEGRVTDPDGNPISGATAVAAVKTADPRAVRRLEWKSAPDGTIVISGLPTGRHSVRFVADGFAGVARTISASDQSLGSVVMTRGSSPRVRIVSDTGPVAGAAVLDQAGANQWRSDSSGEVALAGVDPSMRPLLRVHAGGFLPESFELDLKAPVTEVVLRRGASIRFRLIDSLTGSPASTSSVELRQGSRMNRQQLESPEGDYAISGFEIAPTEMVVRSDGFLPITVRFEPTAAGIDLGAIFLDRGAIIEGILISATTGQPLPGAKIEVLLPHATGSAGARFFGEALRTTTDEEGRFTLSGFEGGRLCGSIEHPSFTVTPFTTPMLEPRTPANLGVITIGATGSVRGSVRADDGKPLDGARVELRAGPIYSPCMTIPVDVDDSGDFRIADVTPGRWTAVALKGRSLLSSTPVIVDAGSESAITIEVPFVDLHASVFLGDVPAATGSLKLARGGSDEFVPPTLFVEYRGTGATPVQQQIGDIVDHLFLEVRDGRAADRVRMMPGEYDVTYMVGSDWYHSRARLADGQKALDLSLQFSGPRISGWVLGVEGTPSSSTWVTLSDGQGAKIRTTQTGPDGSFVFDPGAVGNVTLHARKQGVEARTTVEVREPLADLNLRLGNPVSPRLSISFNREEDTSPIAAAFVTNGREMWRSARPGADGSVRFEFLPEGHIHLFAVDEAGGIHSGPQIQLTAGSNASAAIDIEELSRTTLTTDLERAGSRVRLFNDQAIAIDPILGARGAALYVESDGTVALPPLSEGTWRVQIGVSEPVEVEMKKGRRRIELD